MSVALDYHRMMALFIRQVAVELRAFRWPSRPALIRYTSMVVALIAVTVLAVAAVAWASSGFISGLFG